MLPQSPLQSEAESTKVNLLISLVFHGAIILALVFFAARGGLLGQQLKKISIEMVKETPPQKPKEPEKPAVQPPRAEPPKVVETPKVETTRAEPPKETRTAPPAAAVAAPPAVAPASAELASFEFGGGKAVQTSSDPILLYNATVESALRSKWRRPLNIADDNYAAEIDIAVDHDGRLSDPVWQKSSGDKLWDDSVRQAIGATQGLGRPPPPNFPARVLVRFDVQDVVEPVGISQ